MAVAVQVQYGLKGLKKYMGQFRNWMSVDLNTVNEDILYQ